MQSFNPGLLSVPFSIVTIIAVCVVGRVTDKQKVLNTTYILATPLFMGIVTAVVTAMFGAGSHNTVWSVMTGVLMIIASSIYAQILFARDVKKHTR